MAFGFVIMWGLAAIALTVGGFMGAYKMLTKMENKLLALLLASFAVFLALFGLKMLQIIFASNIFSVIPYLFM